jgi:Carboxypeptidase regulatory-like domain
MRPWPVFLLLAAALSGCGSAAAPALLDGGSGTVGGRVLAAPGCPVERMNSPCPSVPVSGASVRALRGGRVVATVRSGSAGAFLLRLRAGTYALTAANSGGYPSTARALVTVGPGHQVSVTLTVDSGIR